MPSDSNGIYSLPAGYLAVTGEVIQASQHNPPLEDIAASMSARLMRSGAAPMTGPVKVVDGSSGSPAVQFANATSTGLYKTSNGIGVSVGGTKVAEFTSGGLVSGARWLGELIPFTGLTAPALTVMPFGQTLSRATYADLWTFAQGEIAAGNTFYNNGNGTTTFGIRDMRGRVAAAKDNMGGTAASVLTTAGSGVDGATMGAVGGSQSQTLDATQMPPHFHDAVMFDPGHAHSYTRRGGLIHQDGAVAATVPTQDVTDATSTNTTGVRLNSPNGFDRTYSAGGGLAHNNTQPTMICNYLLFAGA